MRTARKRKEGDHATATRPAHPNGSARTHCTTSAASKLAEAQGPEPRHHPGNLTASAKHRRS
eukprot:12689171-Alexandrium_andersonii.AAC.1